MILDVDAISHLRRSIMEVTWTNVPRAAPGTITSQPWEPMIVLTAFKRRVQSFETWNITLDMAFVGRKSDNNSSHIAPLYTCLKNYFKWTKIYLTDKHTQRESQLQHMSLHCSQGFQKLFLISARIVVIPVEICSRLLAISYADELSQLVEIISNR